MHRAWAARQYCRIRVATDPEVVARHKQATEARLQRGLIRRVDSAAGWECQCRCQCQCHNGLIHPKASEDHRNGSIHPKASEGRHKGLGDHHRREWEALDRDGEGLDRVPRGEGVPGRVQEDTVRDQRGGGVQDQDQEGLARLDGLTQGVWGAPRRRAMLAGVHLDPVGMEAVVGTEGTGGREARRLK